MGRGGLVDKDGELDGGDEEYSGVGTGQTPARGSRTLSSYCANQPPSPGIDLTLPSHRVASCQTKAGQLRVPSLFSRASPTPAWLALYNVAKRKKALKVQPRLGTLILAAALPL